MRPSLDRSCGGKTSVIHQESLGLVALSLRNCYQVPAGAEAEEGASWGRMEWAGELPEHPTEAGTSFPGGEGDM